LPLAHVEAPTAGSVLLAGVLLKIGTYGFLRLCLPLAPDASLLLGVPLIGSLAVIGIVCGAVCARAQDDIKKLVAYSSVSHLGFCMLGMFALNATGLSGGLLQMINHGLSTGALFLLVGMLYERYHTRKIGDYGGMGSRLGLLACVMIFICLTSIGLPGLNGFVGEALVFIRSRCSMPAGATSMWWRIWSRPGWRNNQEFRLRLRARRIIPRTPRRKREIWENDNANERRFQQRSARCFPRHRSGDGAGGR